MTGGRVAIAAIYAVVAVERRSWLLAIVVFVPIGGIFYSLHVFWLAGGWLAEASAPRRELPHLVRVDDHEDPLDAALGRLEGDHRHG